MLALALVLLAFICYLANSIAVNKIIFPKSRTCLAVFAIFAATLISAIFSQSQTVSIWGGLVQPDTLVSFIVYALVFFLTATMLKKEDYKKAGIVLFTSLILMMVWVGFLLLQLKVNFNILLGPAKQILNVNASGSFFHLGVAIAFGLVMFVAVLSLRKLRLSAKIILYLASLLATGELFILNYPSVWFLVGLSMIILAAYKFALSNNFARGLGLPLIIIIISFFLVLIASSLPSLVNTPTEVKPNLNSTLKVAKQTFFADENLKWSQKVKNILIGKGPATFSYQYVLYRPWQLTQTELWALRFNQGFSFISTLLTTLGILGILAVLFLIFYFCRLLLKNFGSESLPKEVLIAYLGGLFLLGGWFIHPAFFAEILFVFLALGLVENYSGQKGVINLAHASKARSFLGFITLVGLGIAGMILFYLSAMKYLAVFNYQKGLSLFNQSKNFTLAKVSLNKAATIDPDSDQYWRTLSQVLLLETQDLIAKIPFDSQQAQNNITLAVDAAKKATEAVPQDSLNYENLANVYERILPLVAGAQEFAEKNYRISMDLDPQNPDLPVSLARILMVGIEQLKETDKGLWQKKIDESRGALEKSFALKPDYLPAHFQFAMLYQKEGKTSLAIERLEALKSVVPADTNVAFQLAMIYYNARQLEKAKTELEWIIALNPNFSNALYILGLIYDKQGERSQAREQFERVLELNPDNQEVKTILERLKSGETVSPEI
jgi:Tfp pilus assembly protein PilF